jgi:hypothetical protein
LLFRIYLVLVSWFFEFGIAVGGLPLK